MSPEISVPLPGRKPAGPHSSSQEAEDDGELHDRTADETEMLSAIRLPGVAHGVAGSRILILSRYKLLPKALVATNLMAFAPVGTAICMVFYWFAVGVK